MKQNKEMLQTIRFIALEHATKYGAYSYEYLYIDGNNMPIMISRTRIIGMPFKSKYMPLKHIILYCIYNEYPVESHLAILLQVTRIVDNIPAAKFADALGIDVRTYRLLELGKIENKGELNKNSGIREYELPKPLILRKLNISDLELSISLEDYNE